MLAGLVGRPDWGDIVLLFCLLQTCGCFTVYDETYFLLKVLSDMIKNGVVFS